MNADKDDAPYYLERKRETPWRVVAIAMIGTALTLGGIAMVPMKSTEEPPPARLRITGEPEEHRSYKPQEFQKQEVPTREPRNTSNQNEVATSPKEERQTVFNDRNYTPTGARNVVQTVETQRETITAQRQAKPKEIVVVGAERRLRDYCREKEGSIEQRECKMRADLESRNKGW